jgi:hypothetical protein
MVKYFGTGSVLASSTLVLAFTSVNSEFVAEGAPPTRTEGPYEKSLVHVRVPPGREPQAASPRACRRFHRLYASGRSLSFSSSRDIAPAKPATPPTNRLLQRLRARCLPRALAALDPGHGSCGGALAEVFAESGTLDLTIPQAMNRPRPIRASRSSPRWTTMLHQVTPQCCPCGWPDAAV